MRKKIFIFFIAVVSLLIYDGYHLEEGIVAQKDSISFTALGQRIVSSSQTTLSHEEKNVEKVKGIKVTLDVNSIFYSTRVSENSNVVDVMNHLASTTSFRYTAKMYPGMGAFIEEINGVRNGKGMYWILYVNGSVVSVGASSYIVHGGDQVEWKFEKSN